jgi:hypothetical protein
MTTARRARTSGRRHGPRRALLVCGAVAVIGLVCALVVSAWPLLTQGRAPVGDLAADAQGPAGWTQVFVDDFSVSGPADAAGNLPGGRWWGYPAGTPITNSSNGLYDAGRVVRVQDGRMVFTGSATGANAYGAVMAPHIPSQTYGRYDVRYRYRDVEVAGFKSVWMLWPDSDDWGEGEIDFAEYSSETSDRVSAAVHQACGVTPCPFVTDEVEIDPLAWHTATAVWSPGQVTTYLDGRKVTSTTTGVPDTPMHLLLQFEASSKGETAQQGSSATVQVDWISVYRRR